MRYDTIILGAGAAGMMCAGAACGKTLADLHLPKSVIVGGVQRNGTAFVPRGNTTIKEGDHLIVYPEIVAG